MKSLCSLVTCCLIAIVAMFSGCELITKPFSNGTVALGEDLVLNELYSLSPDKYFAFTWIELYNPTKRPVAWFSATFPAAGLTVGSSGLAVCTENDGNYWSVTHLGSSTEEFHSVTFPFPDSALVGGYDGSKGIVKKIIYDTTGTISVQNLPSPGPKSVNAIIFPLQSRVGYATCNGGLILKIGRAHV